MDSEKRILMLREGEMRNVLLKMGLPTMVGMIVTGIYSLVDAYFVGGLGTSQMGAVSITFPLGQAIVGLAVMFGGGASSYISRLLGCKDREKAGRVASTALYSSLIVAIIMIGLIVEFLDGILYGLGCTETMFQYAKQYSIIYVVSSIFNTFNVTMNNISASEGAAKISMRSMLLGAGINIILDPIVIYTLHQGVAGAAIATAIAQIITSLTYLIYILRKESIFSFSPTLITFSKEIYAEIFKVGIPTLAFQLATCIAMGLTNFSAKEYGDAAIAAIGIVSRITTMGMYAVSGFSKGFQPVAGYNYGAKLYERVKLATSISVKWTSTFCVLVAVIVFIFAKPVIAAFTTGDVEVIGIGSIALRINIITFATMGIQAVYGMLSLALGKVTGGWLLSIGRQGVFFIPLILILPHFIGLNGVILAQPIADVITFICMLALAIKINKELSSHAEFCSQ